MFKVLDASVGSAPVVAFVVVATFLCGMGVGAFLSPKIEAPWRVEAALAGYYVLWLALLPLMMQLNARLLPALVAAFGPSGGPAVIAFFYAAPPAVLLGVTFPALVERAGSAAGVYPAQAIGAFVGVVVVECVLYPGGGLRASLTAMGLLHVGAAALLFGRGDFRFARQRVGRLPAVLLWAGVGTGAFQGVWLFAANLLFHPFYFVQPTVVGVALLGLFIGSMIWRRYQVPLANVLVATVAGMAVSIALVWAWMRVAPPGSVASVALQLAILLLPAAIPIGAIYPAYLAGADVRRASAGSALLALALGNAAGVLIAGAVLTRWLTPGLALASPLGFVAVAAAGRRAWVAAAPLAVALAVGGTLDDEAFIRRGRADHARVRVEQVFRGPGELTAIYEVDRALPGDRSRFVRERKLYQTGYYSITFAPDQGLLTEAMQAAFGISFAPGDQRVLIIGGGTGRTAGFAARTFRFTDVIDISTTVPDLLRYLADENWALLEQPGVTYFAIDAVLAPDLLSDLRYDLIINTTHPSYVTRANKLYTVEFLERIRALLAPGGVYLTWADTESLSPEANQILLNTGRAVFEHQILVSMHPDWGHLYYVVLHSDAELRFAPDRWLARSPLRDDAAARAVLEANLEQHVLPARLHSTQEVHSVYRPSWAILTGGYPHYGNAPFETF